MTVTQGLGLAEVTFERLDVVHISTSTCFVASRAQRARATGSQAVQKLHQTHNSSDQAQTAEAFFRDELSDLHEPKTRFGVPADIDRLRHGSCEGQTDLFVPLAPKCAL